MKAVFPCKGVVVVTKPNVDMLSNFYESHLINSKLFSAYTQNNFAVQVGKLSYLPQNSTILLEKNTNLLTIPKLNQALNEIMKNRQSQDDSQSISTKNDVDPIEDHPFFQTLKPIN